MAAPKKIKGRYEARDVIGKGGMGLVYKAYDTVVQREVALKTLRDSPSKMALDLFRKECGVLASMSHPNIVEIFDIGEFTEEGATKPYFVMPLLPGVTLDHLIKTSSQRLTVERSVEIVLQTCRGLHAAHERGLVHRDLKPSNIFVMPDDTVKIIDFGVAHMADTTNTLTVAGGTLPYMSPEQLEMKPASPLSDIFSLGVVFYETLTRRRPFDFPTEQETAQAIMRTIPPPVSELNPAVSQAISRVIHKAMAKQPWNRFSTAKDFADTLLKAHRNEAIEIFDVSKLEPRIQKATRAYEQGNYQFASELLNELESEGHVETSMTLLRRQIDQAVKQKNISNLLESARACMEEEEYLLALQKIQEIQQLDPNNSAAVGLRGTIDTRRAEQKVDEWTKLARQHLENNAFSHARDALKNLLQLKPKDTAALQLLSEVDRRENDYVKARQQKQELYKAAMEAWQNGEMSSALTKFERLIDLDRRVPDTSAPDRGVSYETSYNRLRSEHDLIQSSYQEARKHLVDGNFQAAVNICQDYLVKYPGHALFQALKFDVEERQRQDLSSRVAEINRRVEGEPELETRVSILREALEMYPGEPLFERSLRLMRDKRDLVNSIVAKARAYEERGQFNEALGQWEILQTIHKQYTGLEFEIERVKRRRDQQSRSEAKSRWVEQIDRLLEMGDYERAIELVRNAVAEFPDDQEMAALDTMAKQSQTRAVEAQQMFAQGQELCSQRKFDEAIELLRKAYAFDQHNKVIRTFLLETLLEQARSLMDTDWRAAEALSQQALELDAGHPLAKGVRDVALDRKREEEVEQWVAEARRMQAAGNVQGAMAQIEQGLAAYPREARLAQLQTTLSKSLPELQARTEVSQRPAPRAPESAPRPAEQPPEGWTQFEAQLRQQSPVADAPTMVNSASAGVGFSGPAARSADLEELQSIDHEAETHFDRASIDTGAQRAQEIAARYPDDPEVQMLATNVTHHLATVILQPGAAGIAGQQGPETGAAAAEPPEKPKKEKKPKATPSGTPGINRTVIWVAAGAAAVLVIVALLVLQLRPVMVRIHANPPGAAIRINGVERGAGDVSVKLRAGSYQLEASKQGYISSSIPLVVERGMQPIELSLKPAPPPAVVVELPPALRLSSDLSRGMVKVDDREAVELKDGEFTIENLGWGKHTLEITSGPAKANIQFEAVRGGLPSITNTPTAKELKAVVVTSFGNQARIQATYAPVKITVADTQQTGEIGPAGLELNNLSAGSHEVVLEEGKTRHTMNLTVGSGPTLQVQLYSDRNVGSLLILTRGEDDVQVEIDGKLQKRKSKGGQVRINGLAVQSHSVRVFKDGFQDEPARTVNIAKGEEVKQEFQLRAALPAVASLAIRGVPPGLQISLDQKLIGTVGPDGNFTQSGVPPGRHVIDVSDGRRHKQVAHEFRAGETVQVGADVIPQAPAKGSVRVTVTPANASVIYKGPDNKPHEVRGGAAELDEGSYTFSASAPGHTGASQPVTVAAGKTVNIALALRPAGAPRLPDDSAGPGNCLAGWQTEGSWRVRRGGLVLCPGSSTNGTFIFTALRQSGAFSSGRIQWVVGYSGAKDYVLYGIDKNKIHRAEIAGGKKVKDADNSESLKGATAKDKLQHSIKVEISQASVVTSVLAPAGNWVIVDTWTPAGRDPSSGKFGFYLQTNDEIFVSNFSFTPR